MVRCLLWIFPSTPAASPVFYAFKGMAMHLLVVFVILIRLFASALGHQTSPFQRILDPRQEWSFVTATLQNLYNFLSVEECIQRCVTSSGPNSLVLVLASVFDRLRASNDRAVDIEGDFIKLIKALGFDFEGNGEIVTFVCWLLVKLKCPCMRELFRTVVTVQSHFADFPFHTEEHGLPSAYVYFTREDRHLDPKLTEEFFHVSGQTIQRPADPAIAQELERRGARFDGTLQPVVTTVTIRGAQILFVHIEREEPLHEIEFHEYMNYGLRNYFLNGMIIRDDSGHGGETDREGSLGSGNRTSIHYAVMKRGDKWFRVGDDGVERLPLDANPITMYQRTVISLFYTDISEQQRQRRHPSAGAAEPSKQSAPPNFRIWFLVPIAAVGSLLIGLAIIFYVLFL